MALLSPALVKAATWTVTDTVTATVDTSASIFDYVMVTGTGNVTLTWHVVNCYFPSDWLTEAAFGICDNKACYNNTGGTYVWNSSTTTGTVFTSNAYSAPEGDFHLQLNLKGASSGTHSVTISISDASLNTRTVTFIITKPSSASVQNMANNETNVALYPNPAHDEVNVVYDPSAEIKNIAVYNIIGKVMAVYKPTDNSSANLNIENLPSGIYFVRLMNSRGAMVATRKFTKQ